ncbi:MAG TPA: M1 family aminopeptidase [Candidatus Acidoferrales bacterium]|nr:M1 family aminopeptidase [Candidatus Acidoferrales bacterium]
MIHTLARLWSRALLLSGVPLLVVALATPLGVRADAPYAPTRDYDLQSVRTHLWFDLEQKKIRGEVSESIALLRDGVTELKLDSSELKIQSVSVDGKEAKFTTPANQLVVALDRPGKRGEKRELVIKYEGQPKKGLHFVLPDKNYPGRAKQIWTQGESEDTHFYIPIYDYPNDRTTSEMFLTVPAAWITVSNGHLVGVKTEADGMKTWHWKQAETLSTYLITAVAGELVEKDDTWRGIPVRYVVPKGREATIDATFSRTKLMLDAFSDRLGVKYPWAQYAQVAVEEFGGGMENTSATTLTTEGLANPILFPERKYHSDGLLSHELAHQWFGDLVTCKDWANIWLNEGFATYFEHYWMEAHYGADDVAYEFWQDRAGWFQQENLYKFPIVTRDTDPAANFLELSGNVYTKGGWVLKMLRSEIGDENFFAGLRHYLEANRGQNVVTADLQKAMEQATGINVDKFFHQWIDRAGAPKFEVNYKYDEAAHQVKLGVKQTQKVEGLVPLFDVSLDVEITTAAGRKAFPIEVSKADETFTFPAESAPLMVLFDRGDRVLKSVEFKKEPAMLIYQLKNAASVPDRADAAVALGELKDNADAVAALGDAAQHDPFLGVREEALTALGKMGDAAAQKEVLAALNNEWPWVRQEVVNQLGNFKDAASLGPKLTEIAANDKAYRVRAAALGSLARVKAANAFETLAAAVKADSPDDVLRLAALRGLGALGDTRGVPVLLEWAAPGKPFNCRSAAIGAVAGLDKGNKEITKALISFLREPYTDVSISTVFALGRRGDPDAIGPLEDLAKSGELNIFGSPFVEGQVAALKAQATGKPPGAEKPEAASSAAGQDALLEHLKKLERQMEEMNARLAKIESQLSAPKK